MDLLCFYSIFALNLNSSFIHLILLLCLLQPMHYELSGAACMIYKQVHSFSGLSGTPLKISSHPSPHSFSWTFVDTSLSIWSDSQWFLQGSPPLFLFWIFRVSYSEWAQTALHIVSVSKELLWRNLPYPVEIYGVHLSYSQIPAPSHCRSIFLHFLAAPQWVAELQKLELISGIGWWHFGA